MAHVSIQHTNNQSLHNLPPEPKVIHVFELLHPQRQNAPHSLSHISLGVAPRVRVNLGLQLRLDFGRQLWKIPNKLLEPRANSSALSRRTFVKATEISIPRCPNPQGIARVQNDPEKARHVLDGV